MSMFGFATMSCWTDDGAVVDAHGNTGKFQAQSGCEVDGV